MKRVVKILAGIFVLGLVACSDGKKTTGVTEDDNAIADGSSCSSVATESSSSSDISLSSSNGETSSSSIIVVPADLWDGVSGMNKVNTQSEESGYWYTWEDYAEGGNSRVILPVEVGNEYSLELLDPVINYCGGLCAEIEFGNTSSPYAGVGFRVADEGKTEDITEWGGICVTYSSNTNFIMNLSSEYDNEAYFRSMPHVVLPHSMGASAPVIDKFMDSSTVVTWCASWHDFFTYDWDNPSDTLWGDVAAKKARAISFVFNGKPGERAIFNIKALSYYDENLPQLSRPSTEQYNGLEVPDADSLTCLWKGVDIGWVSHYEFYENDYRYGPGNGAGYWFSYDDNNASRVKYPVYLSDDYYGIDATDPVIEYCGGFCGTMDLVRDGSIDQAYAGIGFLVAGFEQVPCGNKTCDGDVLAGDIEKWGGLCITYFSAKDAYLMLVVDGVERPDYPSVHLPKSTTMTERCYAWNDFDNIDLNRLKKVYVIDFEIRSDAERESVEFNVAALGKYSTSGSCDLGFTSVPYIPKSSSSSVMVSSSSSKGSSSSSNSDDKCGFSELDDMWYGPSGETFINTGVAKKEKRGGTWFAYAGDSANLMFPKGTVFSNDDFSNIIDYCQGVCATVENKGYGGVGFNIIGEKADGSLEVADITEWGGLCVTYSSMYDLHVAFNDADHNDFSKVETLRYYTLSQTGGYARTSCELWSVLEAKTSTQLDPSKVSSIMFYARGGDNYSGEFNILGVGKYHDITNSPKQKCSEPQRF